jgi:hypothetical protein
MTIHRRRKIELLKEADVIKGAPRSFAIVCVVAIGLIWSGFHLKYKGDLDGANDRTKNAQGDAMHWHETADYYKDLVSRPVQHEAPSSTPCTALTKPSRHDDPPEKED